MNRLGALIALIEMALERLEEAEEILKEQIPEDKKLTRYFTCEMTDQQSKDFIETMQNTCQPFEEIKPKIIKI